MIFTYELTEEELEGINDFITDANIKLKVKDKTSIEKELTKVVRKFLKASSQRLEGKSNQNLRFAYRLASAEDKQKIKAILKLKG